MGGLQSLGLWVRVVQDKVKITVAAYIILGIALIGRELENPFGDDITDIDMDAFLRQLKVELNILTSNPPPKPENFIATDTNFPLGPKSTLSYSAVKQLPVEGMEIFRWTNIRNSRISQEQGKHGESRHEQECCYRQVGSEYRSGHSLALPKNCLLIIQHIFE